MAVGEVIICHHRQFSAAVTPRGWRAGNAWQLSVHGDGRGRILPDYA